MIHYNDLLKKYMHHVALSEGITFVEDWRLEDSEPDVVFTEEEKAALIAMRDQLGKDQ